MEDYKRHLKADPTEWLLEANNPSVRYFALTELLDKHEDDPETRRAKKAIPRSGPASTVLAGQHKDGWWDHPTGYRGGGCRGTGWRFALCAELGVDCADARIRKAGEYLLDVAQEPSHGGFASRRFEDGSANFTPCWNGMMLWSFVRLGWLDDARVRKNLSWVLDHARFDDGKVVNPPQWMTDEDRLGDHACWGRHSCIRGVGPILQALSAIPPRRRTRRVRGVLNEGIEFLLKHHVYRKSHNLVKPMNQRITQLAFPALCCGDVLCLLLILTNEGCRDKRIDDAIQYLVRKQDRDGRWKMQRHFNDRMFVSIEEKGRPSKWITLRALTVLKRHLG